MVDLYLGLAAIHLLAVAMFFLLRGVSQRLPGWGSKLLSLTVLVGMFAYIRFYWHNPRLVEFLPFSNLVVLGNWFPLIAGALGGVAWREISGGPARRSLLVGVLSLAAAFSSVRPLLGVGPYCSEVWRRDICVQTTARTCTPACAATLLRAHGIKTNEAEMSLLCLTREGTSWMGLYRGLKLKTSGTPWDVEVLSCDADMLMSLRDRPMILSVGWPENVEVNEHNMAMAEWGMQKGVGHSVVLMTQNRQNRVRIADPAPSVGTEYWTVDNLRFLYRGTAMRLVRRSSRS